MSYNHCLINHTLNQFLSLIVIKSDNTMLFSMFKFVLSVGFVGEIQFGHGRSDLTFLLTIFMAKKSISNFLKDGAKQNFVFSFV